MGEAYIVAAARTAGGRKNGKLKDWHPVDLGAVVLNELVDRTGMDPARVEDVIMGCVMQVGEQAINVARNAVMASKLPESVPGTSIDRQCGSSQQALQFAAQAVMSGTQDVVIAAGVESMTRVPMGSARVPPTVSLSDSDSELKLTSTSMVLCGISCGKGLATGDTVILTENDSNDSKITVYIV